MIRGTVRIDLSVDVELGDTRDRQQLSVLENCPDGAHVIIDLGARRHVSQDAATWLHQHDARLDIEICAERPDAVGALLRAARAGQWSPA
jgi:hypothetical protein